MPRSADALSPSVSARGILAAIAVLELPMVTGGASGEWGDDTDTAR